jgi:isoleucyl-tRNA synthetase
MIPSPLAPSDNALYAPPLATSDNALFSAEAPGGRNYKESSYNFFDSFDPVAWEKQLLALWASEGTFKTSVAKNAERNGEEFVFQEGPPTANGTPGLHHVLARSFKDLMCRWKTMSGFVVERKAGWDCHGLPVEMGVQKELGLETFADVESFGLGKFNALCETSVWKYEAEWEQLTERMGFWVDLKERYATLDQNYMESEWWALKQLWTRGLLYQGYKVLPYCAHTTCTYSTHEVAQGYKDVDDLTCFVRFPLLPLDSASTEECASLLVWTSTPWTLPANVLLAVNASAAYCFVRVAKRHQRQPAESVDSTLSEPSTERAAGYAVGRSYLTPGELVVVAKARLEELQSRLPRGMELQTEAMVMGEALVGRSYSPPLSPAMSTLKEASPQLFCVVHADFVTADAGTGVVHVAPMYGEDDHSLCVSLGLDGDLKHVVGTDGCYFEGDTRLPASLWGLKVTEVATQEQVLQLLHNSCTLECAMPVRHSYPHCWRSGERLLYYAMDSWFLRMSEPAVKDRMVDLNHDRVRWAPDTMRDGRFGGWLRGAKDWCLSRKRCWGCPLPVWVCSKASGGCGKQHCIGSRSELQSMLASTGNSAAAALPADLHSPFVDALQLRCPCCSADGAMVREPYVLDCW